MRESLASTRQEKDDPTADLHSHLAHAGPTTILISMAKKRSSNSRAPSQRELQKLDREILELINRRCELSVQRSKLSRAAIEQPLAQHAAAIDQIVQRNQGPLDDTAVRAAFRELLSGCRALEQPERVAFLGPEFTYSHLAAVERFGQSAELVPVGSIASVFEEVEQGQVDFGLVPIENSTDGRVVDALECLSRSQAKICGEVALRIRHCLLGLGSRKEVSKVYSKAQPLSQCRKWLVSHLPQAELCEVASTALAAKKAIGDRSCAAIASRQAGVNHSLKVLAHDIQDHPDNLTRFVVIGSDMGDRTGNDKTSLVFELKHEPGALADGMSIFKRQRLNLTWIESFPVPGKRGRYYFFVELQGHPRDLRVRRALASLEKKAVRLTILGSYAQSGPIG